jgi:DNA-binding transcriptional LysR family regulator
MDWNDLKFFLEVVRAGTTLGASKTLRVSQSTVARRIAALEEALGLVLFDKLQSGYVLTEAGTGLVPAAEQAEANVASFTALAGSSQRGLSGIVRLTTNETFANYFLVRALYEFRKAYPGIRLELITGDRMLDIGGGEADVAVRAGPRPVQGELVGKRLAMDIWSVYCSPAYAAQHGIPRDAAEIKGHGFISVDRKLYAGPLIDWVDAHVAEEDIALRQSSLSNIIAGIESGLALGMMSDFLLDHNPKFIKCFTPEVQHESEIWLITHERLRHLPRVRAVMDFLSGYFSAGRHRKAATDE